MRIQITTILLVHFFWVVCKAQTSYNSKCDAISLELGKTGLIYNLNFDHKFQNKNYGFRFSIGSSLAKYINILSAGGGSYYLTGKRNNHVELGFDLHYLTVTESSDDQRGILLFYPDYPVKTYYASINIGYRYYGRKNIFRIGVSPGFIKSSFLPGGYIGFGLAIR